MAYTQIPGRGKMEATGRGIPAGLMTRPPMRQEKNPNTGEDLKKQAQAIADAKLKKNIETKPLGGSTDVRKETGSATNIKLAKTPAEIAAWEAAKNKPGAGRYNQTVTAEATAQGADLPKVETEEIKSTPTPETKPVTENPSTKIYSIQGTRGYTGNDNTGTRAFTTSNPKRVEQEVNFTEHWNNRINTQYAQAEQGSAAARGLGGAALTRRNLEAERRRQALQRPMPTVTTTEADKGAASNAANAMRSAQFESTAEKNKAVGIDKVVYQKKSENKKAVKKMPPVQQRMKASGAGMAGTAASKTLPAKQMKKKKC